MQDTKPMCCPYCSSTLVGGSMWGLFKCANPKCHHFDRPMIIKPSQRPAHAKRR